MDAVHEPAQQANKKKRKKKRRRSRTLTNDGVKYTNRSRHVFAYIYKRICMCVCVSACLSEEFM
jgi:hypothetical protein